MPRTTTAATPVVAESTTAAGRMETNCLCCNRKLNSALRSELSHLCTVCYDEAGYENAHNDGHHSAEEQGPNEVCHLCTGANPHAGIRTRVASGNQGKVVNPEADRRIKGKAQAPATDAAIVAFPARPTLRGKASPSLSGLTYQVLKSNHKWAGHTWTQVRIEGMDTNKWFWTEDLVRTARGRRTAAA